MGDVELVLLMRAILCVRHARCRCAEPLESQREDGPSLYALLSLLWPGLEHFPACGLSAGRKSIRGLLGRVWTRVQDQGLLLEGAFEMRPLPAERGPDVLSSCLGQQQCTAAAGCADT